MQPALIIGIVIATVVLLGVYASVTVVRPDEAIVVFRLGRGSPDAVRGPGLQLVLPAIDRAVRVRMAEQSSDLVVHGTSKDDIALTAEARVRWRVLEPFRYAISLASPDEALRDVAGRALELVDADDAIVNAGRAARAMETRLHEAGTQWGITIAEVDVRRVTRGSDSASSPGA